MGGREERVGGREERVEGRKGWEEERRGWEEGKRWEGGRRGWKERESCSNHTQVINTQITIEKWKKYDADKTEEKRDEPLKLTHATTVT